MGEALVQSNVTLAAQSPAGSVAYVPLPRFVPRVSVIYFLAVFIAVFALLMIWAAIDPSLRTHVACALGIGLIALPAGLLFSNVSRSDHFDVELTNPLTQIVVLVDRRLWNPYLRRQWWTWSEFIEQCREAHVDPPRTIVDKRVKARLERIESTPEFLEPEPILSSGTSGRKASVLMIIFYCLFTVLQLSVGNYLFAAIFAAFGVFLAATYPPIRDSLRMMRFDEGNVVAGMGSLSQRGEKHWTVSDAMMLVQTKNGSPPYYVSFVGEAGYKLLTFTDERDPDFVKLWQRWNHPKPRPELVVE